MIMTLPHPRSTYTFKKGKRYLSKLYLTVEQDLTDHSLTHHGEGYHHVGLLSNAIDRMALICIVMNSVRQHLWCSVDIASWLQACHMRDISTIRGCLNCMRPQTSAYNEVNRASASIGENVCLSIYSYAHRRGARRRTHYDSGRVTRHYYCLKLIDLDDYID